MVTRRVSPGGYDRFFSEYPEYCLKTKALPPLSSQSSLDSSCSSCGTPHHDQVYTHTLTLKLTLTLTLTLILILILILILTLTLTCTHTHMHTLLTKWMQR